MAVPPEFGFVCSTTETHMKSFRELSVWREGMDLAEVIYRATERFPKREWYGLAAQMRRSAVSIPSNIAEGQGRFTLPDRLRFLGHARGSLFELETQIEVAKRCGYLDDQATCDVRTVASRVGRALSGYIKYIQNGAGRTEN